MPSVNLISNSSSVFIASMLLHSIIGSPIFIAFLKNILANDEAKIHLIPTDLRAIGAYSLLEPHPKFDPATNIV
jgi:hypothetical protein